MHVTFHVVVGLMKVEISGGSTKAVELEIPEGVNGLDLALDYLVETKHRKIFVPIPVPRTGPPPESSAYSQAYNIVTVPGDDVAKPEEPSAARQRGGANLD